MLSVELSNHLFNILEEIQESFDQNQIESKPIIYFEVTSTENVVVSAETAEQYEINLHIDFDHSQPKEEEKGLKDLTVLPPYKKIKEEDPVIGCSCSICLEEYEVGTYKRELSCSHTFHKKCIDKWLLNSNCCPLCKRSF